MEIIALGLLVAGIWWLFARRGSRGVADAAWTGATTTIPATRSERDAARGSAGTVLAALTRVEARTHATTLPFTFGVVLTAMCAFAMLGWVDIFDNSAPLGRYFLHFGLFAYPVTGMVLLIANRAALRDRREGTTELFTATPADPALRTASWITATWPSVLVLAVGITTVVAFAANGMTESRSAGPWGPAWTAEVALAFVLVIGGAALGVALARWIPHGLVAPVALVGLLVATISINGLGPPTDRTRYFAPWASPPNDVAPEFMTRPSWQHLLYVVGLVTIVLALAWMATRRDRRVVVTLVAGVTLTALGATLQLAPPSTERIAAIGELIETGGDRCAGHDGIVVCTYPGYDAWRDRWIEAADATFAVVPVRHRGYRVVQTVGAAGRTSLDPGIRRRLREPSESETSGLGFGDSPAESAAGAETSPAWVVPAHAAVGLPRTVGANGHGCYAGGQARAVLAMWALVEASGLETARWQDRLAAEDDGIGSPWPGAKRAQWATAFWPASWNTDTEAPVVFARSDVRLALALAARSDTRDRLAERWTDFTRPAATSSDLAAALGVVDPTDSTTTRLPRELERCS